MFDTPDAPQMPKGTLAFRLWKIPVTIRPFFWLIAILFSPFFGRQAQFGDSRILLLGLLAWIGAWFLNFMIHELGHALTARALYGARPQITLFGFGGVTTWNPYYTRSPGRWGDTLTSLAGPGAELAVTFLLIALLAFRHVSLEWGSTAFGPIP
ncbi:MAG: hypothetical protein J6S42_06995, partial [Thermoguttaceae bacterium]|nr:hypothetical protein [Thermoguttaceae bacterium]